MSTIPVHQAAALVVSEVVDGGRSLDEALQEVRPRVDERSRALLQELGYGGCRFYHYYQGMLALLLQKPLKKKDRIIHFLLVNGCYQLDHMRTPDHAVVNEVVESVRGTRQSWAARLLNGVLRRYLREREALTAALSGESDRDSFPGWLHRQVRSDWPQQAAQIFAASNEKPPLTLRINQARCSREACLAELEAAGIAAASTRDSAVGITLQRPLAVESIPGFTTGLISVQDESAQLVAAALELSPGMNVLDGCAAPGGKTCLLLESEPGLGRMVAVDLEHRLAAIRDNLERLQLQAEVVSARLEDTASWWDGRPYDRILLDVPCSGSGVVRRHPDIKHRRRQEDISQFAAQQLALLRGAWPSLANGGKLLYVTCSLLHAENDEVIGIFTETQQEAVVERPGLVQGVSTRFGSQRLPGVHTGDGFYYCRLRKSTMEESAKCEVVQRPGKNE